MSSFDYLGESFTYAAEFPAFAYAEFCEAMEDGEEAGSARAMGVALRLAVECVDESDRARFRRVSRKNSAKAQDWLKVFRDWTAAEAERPTGQPTDSSSGPESIPQNSGTGLVATVTELPVRGDVALALSRSAV